MHRKGIYLIGRVVVFQDPYLARARPDLAIQRPDGSVWTTSAGLGWVNPYDRRVWDYSVSVAAAAARAGFDEIMLDYVRFPSDGDVGGAVYPGRTSVPKGRLIADFAAYAQAAARAARRARLDGAVRALRDARHRHRPGAALDLAARRPDPPDVVPGALRRRRARHRLAERRARRDGVPHADRLQAADAGAAARSSSRGSRTGTTGPSRCCSRCARRGCRAPRASCSGTPRASTRRARSRRPPEARASRSGREPDARPAVAVALVADAVVQAVRAVLPELDRVAGRSGSRPRTAAAGRRRPPKRCLDVRVAARRARRGRRAAATAARPRRRAGSRVLACAEVRERTPRRESARRPPRRAPGAGAAGPSGRRARPAGSPRAPPPCGSRGSCRSGGRARRRLGRAPCAPRARPSGVAVASAAASGSCEPGRARLGEPARRGSRAGRGRALEPGVHRRESTVAGLGYAGGDGATRTIEIRTEIPGPRSRALAEREERVIAHPLLVHLPIFAERAENATITDVDGNVFVDFAGGVGVVNVGHAHPRDRRGGRRAGRAVPPHRLHGRPLRAYVALAERLCALAADLRRDACGVLQRRHRGGRERRQARAPAHRPAGRDRVRGRLPRPHAALDDDDVEVPPLQDRDGAVRARGLPRPVPERLPRAERRRGARPARAAVRDARRRPSTSRRSSSSRSSARAGSSPRRASSSRGCARSATATGSSSSPTRCRPASAAPGACSRWSTSASSPT